MPNIVMNSCSSPRLGMPPGIRENVIVSLMRFNSRKWSFDGVTWSKCGRQIMLNPPEPSQGASTSPSFRRMASGPRSLAGEVVGGAVGGGAGAIPTIDGRGASAVSGANRNVGFRSMDGTP